MGMLNGLLEVLYWALIVGIIGSMGLVVVMVIKEEGKTHKAKSCQHEWTERGRFILRTPYTHDRVKAECIRCFAQADFSAQYWYQQRLSQWDLEQLAKRQE